MGAREPFNTWSHCVGLVLAAAGTTALLVWSDPGPERAAFGVYGGTLILLYAASTVYHAVRGSPGVLRALRTLDHIAIYLLIAGTYTPVALLTLDDAWGWALLGSVWAVAGAGIPFMLRYLDAPVWVSTATYLAMGHLALLAAGPLLRQVGPAGLAWLVAGGLAYTVGAIIFTRERPDPLPRTLGYHGLWHILVLVGSACHYTFMVLHVLPG